MAQMSSFHEGSISHAVWLIISGDGHDYFKNTGEVRVRNEFCVHSE